MAQQHVLVTGGTSGIGRAIAEAFAREQSLVTVTGRTDRDVTNFLAHPRTEIEISARRMDVTEASDIAAVFRGQDRLDVLINAAGTILREGRELEPDGFEAVVDVNLVGTMRVCTAACELLFTSSGCVINIASMLSFFGSGYVPAYSASKGGIVQLTKSLAIAWAAKGVRVNAIAPGWIETAMTAPLVADPARREAIIARTPLARWGQPEDVAGAALFLASPAAAYITGIVLPVDGGYSAA
ncbi:MAG TPA: SDR family oxidoreductase [Pirellulaceae bacterium]|nr:SDR family oxidoreductase [Pirellulaceae bacterium]